MLENSGNWKKISKAFSRKHILFIKNVSDFHKTAETSVDPHLGEATPGLLLELFYNEKKIMLWAI